MGKISIYLIVSVVALLVFGFIFLVIRELPSDDEVSQVARPLENLPLDFFKDDYPLNLKIRQLKVPNGVPVQLNQGNLGRPNVFLSF